MVKGLTAALAAVLVTAAPAGAAPVTTTSGDTRRVELSGSGTVGMVSYGVTHAFEERVTRPARLPGVKVERDGAFAGAFGDSALLGAWMAPPRVRQFLVEGDLLEHARLHTRFDTDAVPLNPGDRFGMAFAHVPFDAPLDPEGDRAATADGEIAWDHAVDVRRVTGRYGGRESSSDAIFVRGDVVARGGDVDARGGNMRVPPLVIDLPKVYPGQTEAAFAFSISLPSTVHLAGIDVKIVPTAGKAVIRTNLVGYVPEAREFTAPGGAEIKEWHLPITGAIMLSEEDSPLVSQPSVTLPRGGLAVVGRSGEPTRVLRAASGRRATPEGLTATRRARRGERADAGVSGTGATDELTAAAAVTAKALTAPRELTLGNGAYELTLDPDFRGSGALAITDLRRGATGTPFLDALSVPFVRIDGEAVALTADRLSDLRVLPIQRIATITQTGWGIGADSRPVEGVRMNRTNPYQAGMLIDLVYDLPGGREVSVHVRNGGDPLRPLDVVANATVRDRAGAVVGTASPILHLELPEGEVALGGERRTTEFSAPLDDADGPLTVGSRSFLGRSPRPVAAVA
jgi:hypothetical protein